MWREEYCSHLGKGRYPNLGEIDLGAHWKKKKAAFSNQGVEPIGMNTYLEKEALINIYFYL